jgi:uncharacterized protein
MPRVKLTTPQDCEDFVRGCTFYGTGGGGRAAVGLSMLLQKLDEGREVGWIDLEDIPDDIWTVSPFGMGSIAPRTPETMEKMKSLGLDDLPRRYGQADAVRELAKYLGVEIKAIIACELGGGNTPGPMAAAIDLGLPVVDCDLSGRAAPSLAHSTSVIYGKPVWPLAAIDPWGNLTIIKDSANTEMAERVGKYVSIASFGELSMAGYLLNGKDLKACAIPGTLTKSLEVGRAIREARESGADPAEAAAKAADGWLIFKGVLRRQDWEDKEGYMYGTIFIDGEGAFAGQEFSSWFQNEYHVSWLNGKPFVTSPDLICIINSESGEPYTNTELEQGSKVAIIATKAPEAFRTPGGLAIMGPKYFGFDLPYVPVEDLV